MSDRVRKPSPMLVHMAIPRGRQETSWSFLTKLPLRVGQFIRGSLRAKFIIVIVSLILALMGVVTFVVERHQHRAIFEQTQLRALALGASLAAVSEAYLLSYDFIQLEQIAEQLTMNNADVRYAVAHLPDGKVGAFSRRRNLQGKRLDDPVSQRALQATAPLVQDIILPDSREPGYDVAMPVYGYSGSQKWGTVRVGFSLQRAYALMQQTRRDLLWLSLAAVGCGTLLAAVLALRISKPIGQLVAEVHTLAKGAYDQPIRTRASDEIGYLAHTFEQMRASLQCYLMSLTQHEAALQRKVEETRTLYEIGQEITAQVTLEPTLDLIVERARALSHAESSLLALRQGASDTFRFQASSGTVPEALTSVSFGAGEGLSGCAALTTSPITVSDALRAYPESPFLEALTQMGVRSVVAVPLQARGTVIGVLALTSQAAHQFRAEDQQLLSALADQAAIAIENAKLYEQVRQYAEELEATVAVRTQELREANQHLAAASRHKSEFLANVSHELRTPLTAIKGSVDNMLDGLTGVLSDKQRRYLTRIKANTDRLARLIHDLLDLARIEAGKVDLQPTRLPVAALTQEVAESLWPMAAEKHLRLDVTAADASVTAWADREQVTQVLMNLLGNAVKFTPAHGTVAVAIHKSGDAWVQISVTDTGPGIPAEEATHIFEKFYQIVTAGRPKTTGTGLGLAIAKSLVEMQQGQLWVESAVGRGSTFAFTLPVQPPGSLAVATPA